MPVTIGQTISHHRIVRRLGAGAMGEVYLAEDEVLRRKVALKILPDDVVADPERLRRFEREATSASSLSHTNIVVVHEFGHAAGTYFIALEYVDGETLREAMRRTRFSIAGAVDVGIQAASAIAAAQKAGIVHRDIKPENMMIREDGTLKLLDFGLAKTDAAGGAFPSGAAQTASLVTSIGRVLGTVQYMSPEQARGQPLDSRSDIFSLGTVLYEMCTGGPPFAGDTPSDVIAALLSRDPPETTAAALPAELDRIIRKALRKDPDERYQSAQELYLDLKALRRALDASSDPQRAAPETRESVTRHSDVTMVAGVLRRHRALTTGVVVLLLGAAGLVWWRGDRVFRPPAGSERHDAVALVPLTSSGNAVAAAMSPDGRYVAYALGNDSRQSLWLRQTDTAQAVQVLAPASLSFWSVAFSPDGHLLHYVAGVPGAPTADFYSMPVLGGGARKLIAGIASSASVSPDGTRVAFFRRPSAGELQLTVRELDGRDEHPVATLRDTGFTPEYAPAWSPDGARLACLAPYLDSTTGALASRIVIVALKGQSQQEISHKGLFFVRDLVWHPDGASLLAVAQQRPTAYAPQIWQIAYPGGDARQLTNQLEDYQHLSLDGSGTTLVSVQRRVVSRVSVAPLPDLSQPTTLSPATGSMEGKAGLVWTPDGQLVYGAFVTGDWVLLASDPDGQRARQLTFAAGYDSDPAVSRDGRTVVFASNREGGRSIWRMDMDGGSLRRLTNGPLDWLPAIAPDGSTVYYAASVQGKRTIWKVGLDGGGRSQVSTTTCDAPSVSPDGQFVACVETSAAPDGSRVVAILPAAGGSPVTRLRAPATMQTLVAHPRWTPDGNAVAYVDSREGVSNIWTLPLAGGAPRQLTSFTSGRIYKFDFSPDGRRLAWSHGSITSDAVLVTGLR